jgi:hypothetical protein
MRGGGGGGGTRIITLIAELYCHISPIVEIIGFYYTEAIFLVFTFPWEAVFANITLEIAKCPDKRKKTHSG